MNGFDPGEGWRMEQFEGEVPTGVVAFREDDGSWSYWVREAPVPPLPTEPGYYLTTEPDYGGGPVVVELLNRPAGQWVDAGDRQYLTRMQVEDMLPLVRLEPHAVTAKAVLDAVRPHLPGLRPDDPVIAEIAREFGVES